MKLSSQQLPSGKWGIYSDTGLLATVESQVICETIMANLASGRRDAPYDDVNALYQVPKLRKKTGQSAEVPSERKGAQTGFVTAPKGRPSERKGNDAEAMKTSQASAQGAKPQKTAAQKTAKTTQAQLAAEPLIGQAKSRANASAKRKRRSTSRTDTSLAS